jgi:hypothetical protein
MDHHGMYQAGEKGWGGSNNFWTTSNPYSQAFGGPCANADEFFTSPEAAKLYEKRLRYLVARYGYSPRLHSWEFFNEIDNIYREKTIVPEHVVAWHEKMAPALKKLDPYGHLVSTSVTGGSERPDFWKIPGIDYTVYHSYGDPAPARKIAFLAARFDEDFGKPFLVGECGTSAYTLNLAEDPYLRGFRQLLWGGVTGGSAGTAMSWWWEDIHANDLYPVYAALSRIAKEAGWNEGEWTPLPVTWSAVPTQLGGALSGAEPFSSDVSLNSFPLIALSGEAAIGSPIDAMRSAESLHAYLVGKTARFRVVDKIRINAGEKATLLLRVDSVSADARLVVRIDGAMALERTVAFTGASNVEKAGARLEETLDLDRGCHEIAISNESDSGWLHLSTLRLANLVRCAPANGRGYSVEATGIVGKRSALLHVVSPWAVYPANAKVVNPPLVTDGAVSFSGLPAGDYKVRWYNTMDGSLVAESALQVGDAAVLKVPPFRDDLAAVILPVSK